MALTVTTVHKRVLGNEREHAGTLNLGTYATNGVAFTPANFGLYKLRDLMIPDSLFTDGTVRDFAIDWPNQKIKCFVGAGTESTAVDLSAMSVNWRARGI